MEAGQVMRATSTPLGISRVISHPSSDISLGTTVDGTPPTRILSIAAGSGVIYSTQSGDLIGIKSNGSHEKVGTIDANNDFKELEGEECGGGEGWEWGPFELPGSDCESPGPWVGPEGSPRAGPGAGRPWGGSSPTIGCCAAGHETRAGGAWGGGQGIADAWGGWQGAGGTWGAGQGLEGVWGGGRQGGGRKGSRGWFNIFGRFRYRPSITIIVQGTEPRY